MSWDYWTCTVAGITTTITTADTPSTRDSKSSSLSDSLKLHYNTYCRSGNFHR
jgi:hypothetical protein